MFYDLVVSNRSYRRFYEEHSISEGRLLELVNYGRLSASGANKQPLKYIISSDKEKNQIIFPHLLWAGYLKDWSGPKEGERPSGYIIILQDKKIGTSGVDHGIAAQSILLGARSMDLGGCMIQSIKRDELQTALHIPDQYEILLVLALGKPKEVVIIEEIEEGEDIKYWRDERQEHHVPKRKMKDVVLTL
ncbi:nitroreductase family protein [Pelosinus sp. UFO1]|uniref:nitroreductase family protein n=1 Tax=Pelosinus sp. UFO1 TaxID=484770 RepID=UPI0004D173B9|nr:nitroreductase family protein [Pelosinus sp. UFO1]AIF49973.1 nitroreductase [Pelosinus sp. UFO1]